MASAPLVHGRAWWNGDGSAETVIPGYVRCSPSRPRFGSSLLSSTSKASPFCSSQSPNCRGHPHVALWPPSRRQASEETNLGTLVIGVLRSSGLNDSLSTDTSYPPFHQPSFARRSGGRSIGPLVGLGCPYRYECPVLCRCIILASVPRYNIKTASS